MKHKEELAELVTCYDYELGREIENGHSDDWYNVHINMLYNELCEVRDTLFVFENVEEEWEKRVENKAIKYSRIRSIVYEALPYKVIMGLSKIFVGTKEFSIEKKSYIMWSSILYEYSRAAEPPVRCGESHHSGLAEPPFIYSYCICSLSIP